MVYSSPRRDFSVCVWWSRSWFFNSSRAAAMWLSEWKICQEPALCCLSHNRSHFLPILQQTFQRDSVWKLPTGRPFPALVFRFKGNVPPRRSHTARLYQWVMFDAFNCLTCWPRCSPAPSAIYITYWFRLSIGSVMVYEPFSPDSLLYKDSLWFNATVTGLQRTIIVIILIASLIN